MAQRSQRGAKKHAVLVGTNRGGFGFVHSVPATTPDAVGTWEFVDPKPGRAAGLATIVQRRFPTIRTAAHEVDGREAPRQLADEAVIIGTVDTAEATRALIDSRRASQSLIFQLVGRGPGPAMTATRLGISGVIHEPYTQAEARLLFEGFAAIAAEASSRAHERRRCCDRRRSAALRRTVTRQSTRYFADVLRGGGITDFPLNFFTSSGQYPLAVRPSDLDLFSNEEAQALELVNTFETRRVGVVAAVALVSVEAGMDVLFVSRTRNDRRKVERVMTFRMPVTRFDGATVFTD